MNIAIITGASSGLGAEFAEQLANTEKPDELWLIARREERLHALAGRLPVKCRVLPLDVTDSEAMEGFRKMLKEEKPNVRTLIVAAGMGKIGTYRDIDRKAALAMVRLNCEAAVDMTESVLPYMEGGARILEIASTSAFQPLQGLNIYAATKAFLLRYSRGLGAELLPRGIRVTAVCPYWIKDTEFIPVAKETESAAVRHFPLASKRKNVAAASLLASRLGFPVCTPGVICTLHRIVSALPDSVLMLGWEGIRRA